MGPLLGHGFLAHLNSAGHHISMTMSTTVTVLTTELEKDECGQHRACRMLDNAVEVCRLYFAFLADANAHFA